VAHGDVVRLGIVRHSSSALGVRQVRERRSATSLGLPVFVGDDGGGDALPLRVVPNLHLVVVGRGDDVVARAGEAPHFSFRVRLHERLLRLAAQVDLVNGAFSEAHEGFAAIDVNRSDEVAEVDGLLHSH